MKRVKVIISYAELPIANLIEFGRNVVGKMTTNVSTFTSPDVALATITALNNNLETKFNAAHNGGKQQKLEMEEARKALLEALRTEAMYIERVAKGNEIVIVSSGFECSRQPQLANRPDFLVENADIEGGVILKRKKVIGAQAWVWQQSTEPLDADKWKQIAITTQASIEVNNLTPCTRYWFRSSYVDKNGQSDWTEAKMIIVT